MNCLPAMVHVTPKPDRARKKAFEKRQERAACSDRGFILVRVFDHMRSCADRLTYDIKVQRERSYFKVALAVLHASFAV